MWVPLGWLGEWVDCPSSVEDLAESLTRAGLEVDSIERSGPDLSQIVVGHVLEREQHPDADRLSVCTVDLGAAGPEDGAAVTIVCGAPNVDAGQKVAVARTGTRLQGKKLKKSKIRGVTSNGMICSESELELSEESDGILVLDADAPVGATLDDVLTAGETVLEIAITANRGDCASMLGIAREVAAWTGAGPGGLRMPEAVVPETGPAAADAVRVEIEDAEGCHAYAARVVRGVRIGSSPEWLQARLEAAQLRPINVVVDITNLVLLEYGQPLHAFDLAKVAQAEIHVRSARAGETLETLDGVERKLEAGDLVIADAERAIALAGVMGGSNSEVADDTTDVLLESAHFHPGRVRRSARRLGLTSDASYRFERGVDPEGLLRALDRAARLLAELAGGEVASGVVQARGDAPDTVAEVRIAPQRVNRMLGTALSLREVSTQLGKLGIEAREEGDELRCSIPSHRNDLRIPADLVEEVSRMHGLDQIEPQPMTGLLVAGTLPLESVLGDQARDALAAEGLLEVQTFPFVEPAELDRLGLDAEDPRRSMPRVVNPIVEAESGMRSTHVPSLLRCVRDNLSRQLERVAIFEVARVFRATGAGELPEERLRVTALLVPGEEARLWSQKPEPPLFYAAKGIAERLFTALGRPLRFGSGATEPYLHPGASCPVLAGKQLAGIVGELHPAIAARFEIDSPCALIEIDLSQVADLPRRERRYREVSRHPQVRRDLAIVVDRGQAADALLGAIRKKAGEALLTVEVFDRYEGKGVPEGKVSLAFRLIFQRTDRTLTDEEVSKATDGVLQMLAQRFDAEQR